MRLAIFYRVFIRYLLFIFHQFFLSIFVKNHELLFQASIDEVVDSCRALHYATDVQNYRTSAEERKAFFSYQSESNL